MNQVPQILFRFYILLILFIKLQVSTTYNSHFVEWCSSRDQETSTPACYNLRSMEKQAVSSSIDFVNLRFTNATTDGVHEVWKSHNF